MQIQATQLKEGTIIVYQKELCRIFTVQHITPGNKRGMVQAKMKKLSDKTNIEHRFRSTDFVEKAVLETRTMEFLYNDNTGYHFMDTENYEQCILSSEDMEDHAKYLTPNTSVQLEFHEGKPVSVILPITVDLRIVDTEPILKGATASGGYKPATTETDLVVQVPPFIDKDEVVRVDTRTGKYVERVTP